MFSKATSVCEISLEIFNFSIPDLYTLKLQEIVDVRFVIATCEENELLASRSNR